MTLTELLRPIRERVESRKLIVTFAPEDIRKLLKVIETQAEALEKENAELRAENARLREAIEAALSSIRWSRVQDKTENRNNCILSAETVLNDAITTHKSGAV